MPAVITDSPKLFQTEQADYLNCKTIDSKTIILSILPHVPGIVALVTVRANKGERSYEGHNLRHTVYDLNLIFIGGNENHKK